MEKGSTLFIQGNADLLPLLSATALSVTTSQTKAKPLQHPQANIISKSCRVSSNSSATFFMLATKFLFFSFSWKSRVEWGMESYQQVHSLLHLGFISIQQGEAPEKNGRQHKSKQKRKRTNSDSTSSDCIFLISSSSRFLSCSSSSSGSSSATSPAQTKHTGPHQWYGTAGHRQDPAGCWQWNALPDLPTK